MNTIRSVLTVACALLLSGCAGAPQGGAQRGEGNCEWRVCITWRDSPGGRTYFARNSGPVAATVTLSFTFLRNLRVPERLPMVRVVGAHSTATLAFLDAMDRDTPRAADPAVQVDLGSAETRPDDYLYGMPFGGTERRTLVQGFNGGDSHMLGMRWALDFAMPEGTPVVAARDGIVVHVQDGFTEGGVDPDLLERANLVVVAHGDGTLASYGHLRPGIRVALDDAVAEGDLLGYSGATGFAGQPHLHFHVGVRAMGDPGRTIRIRMKGATGEEVALTTGSSYEPAAGPGTSR